MTFNEFSAWLEGYECSFDNERPTREQWQAIKAKLASISQFKPNALGLVQQLPLIPPASMKAYYGDDERRGALAQADIRGGAR